MLHLFLLDQKLEMFCYFYTDKRKMLFYVVLDVVAAAGYSSK